MSWNEKQQKAITARSGSVVVSAAAGSGKTSVLTERVLRLIEEGGDIERMLIVTFTNLAAAEMKERIFRALQEAGGARLAAQAEKCAFADISTIHAFCGRVIRDNFEQAGVPPTFSVGDEASISAMKQRAMDDAAENAAKDLRLRAFIEKFSARGDMRRIGETVFAIYERVISQKEPLVWLDRAEANFQSNGFIEALFQEHRQMACEAAREASVHLEQRSAIWSERGFPEEADKSERERISILRAAESLCVENTYMPMAEQISVSEKGAPNRESKTHSNRANKCLESLSEYEGGFAAKVGAELAEAEADAKAFLNITRDFMRKYAALKRQKNMLDHDDMIHFAQKALSVPEIAQRYKEKYEHVFVDEYQDINDTQNAILKLVQRERNDFIVGDVKQCIYMFRESNPELLIQRCFELAETGLIEMNTNYRSEPGVIAFINGVMRGMMTGGAGGVEYAGGQTLEAARDGEGTAEILLAGRDGQDSLTAEGVAIAAYIKELVSQGFKYGDIAVLRPEVSASGRRIAKALTDAGIPVISGTDGIDARFCELAVFLNLISLIDGSAGDTELLSAMRFPHFGFTEPELAAIRLAQRNDVNDKSFYYAAESYAAKDPLGKKLEAFFGEIERYRKLSQCLKLPDFLMRLRREAEFAEYALTSPAGAAGDSAILSLINAVSSMSDVRFGDIPGIADRIASKQQQKPGEADAVYLTTIHKSKGLEFPAVILSGMHKTINQRDAAGPVLVGRGLGLAIDIVDEKARTRRLTLHKKAVARGMKRETISETIRLIYVGMTRAQKRLAILGAGDGIKESWLEAKHPGWQYKATTYFDLIMPAAAAMCVQEGRDIDDIVRIVSNTAETKSIDRAARLSELLRQAESMDSGDICEGYAFEKDLGVPSKVSVSALKRGTEKRLIKPQYAPDEGDISAAERGTLMHRALQYIGLEERSEQEVGRRIAELAREGVIDKELAEFADAKDIARFLESALAGRARKSATRLSEAPFCLSVKAGEIGLGDSDESVIVQGVIDMCFEEDGRWVVVDYKTDRSGFSEADAEKKYGTQLSLYARALEAITSIPVKEKIVYFLTAGREVSLP